MNSDYEFGERTTPPHLTGNEVVDWHLDKVGTVTDVLFDDAMLTARWVIVKTGLFRSEHIMPLDETYVDEAGRLVAPLNKAAIRRAPRAPRDHVLTIETRRDLRDYYGIAA